MASVDTAEFIGRGVIVFLNIFSQRSGPDTYFYASGAKSRRVRVGVRLASNLLLVLFIASSSAKPAAPRHIEVVAKRYAFEPAEITVQKGEAVELELSSADVPHGLRIRDLKIDVRVSKGKKAEALFTPQATGTFVGHCSVFCGAGHGEMTLTIHVVA